MKRKTKIGLGIAIGALGALALSGCTASFCSTVDRAHIIAAYDNGVSKFFDSDATEKPEKCYEITTIEGVNNVWFAYSFSYNNGGLTKTNENAKNNNIEYLVNNCEYWASFDLEVITQAVKTAKIDNPGFTVNSAAQMDELLTKYGYLRFSSNNVNSNLLWDNWSDYDVAARNNMKTYGAQNLYGISYDISKIPTNDYIKLYKSTMEGAINNFRGCITTNTGNFGSYGWELKTPVEIEGKSYQYGWSKGFFEGLLVYPIAALIDVVCNSLQGAGTGIPGTNTNGWAQLLTILIVTFIVRAFIFLVSFKSTLNNAKMTELQPQIAKIQAKYPDANTNQSSKARMADEMNKLYKKNHINPFSSILVMIVQFPVFICVWGAFTGSAWLSTGQFLGLNLSDSISSVLFNGANWANGSAWTALVLFLLMAGSQVMAMLIPQWLQKKRQAKVAKLGKNPAQNQQNKTMKIVTWVMMIMIIFMGFSLASAMGVYWFVGALISVIQTLITQAIIGRQSKEKKN